MILTTFFFFFILPTIAFSLEIHDVETLKNMLLEFRKEKIEMQRQLNFLSEKVKQLENDICDSGKHPGKRLLIGNSETYDSTKIAFFANTVPSNHNWTIHQPLAFGNVITNVGNSYHKETGMFVCTVPGYYAFSANILLAPGAQVRTTMVKNGAIMQQIYTGDPTNHSNGGATIVLHVKAGDLVWVRLETTDGAHIYDWESHFTGFLLYED